MMKLQSRCQRPFRSLLLLAAIAASASGLLSSCTPVCDYPLARVAKIRPVNAMPDQEQVSIWLNGKLFKKDYGYTPPGDFGYYTKYSDNTPLTIGGTKIVVTSDPLGKDTLVVDSFNVSLRRQTLVPIGISKYDTPFNPICRVIPANFTIVVL